MSTLAATGDLFATLAAHGLSEEVWLKMSAPRNNAKIISESDMVAASDDKRTLADVSSGHNVDDSIAETERVIDLEDFLLAFLKYIPVKEAVFIFLHFAMDYNLKQISAFFGCAESRVSQVKGEVLRQLPKRLTRFLRFNEDSRRDVIENFMEVGGGNFSQEFLTTLWQELAVNSVTPEEEILVSRVFANEIVKVS